MAKSRARFLAELLGTDGLVKKAKSALAGADEVIDLSALPSIPNSKLTNSSITINSSATSLGGSVTLTTANVAENTNLYYTDARVDARITAADTGDLSEGSNLYYTDARADARVNLQTGSNLNLSSKDTGDLSEGSNLYYTNARADARIAAASTSDLSEGSNLYYTDARADARVALVVDSAPSTLNTLNELAAALGDDANFSTTVTNSIAAKLPLAGGALTGNLTTNSRVAIGQSSVTGGNVLLDLHGSGNGVGAQSAYYNDHNTSGFFVGLAGNTTGNPIIYNVPDTNIEFYTNNAIAVTIASGGTTFAGTVSSGGYQVNGTTVIDSGRNITMGPSLTIAGDGGANYTANHIKFMSHNTARGAGHYMMDDVGANTWYTGTGYSDAFNNWGVHYKAANEDEETAHTQRRVFSISKVGNVNVAGTFSSGAITSSGTLIADQLRAGDGTDGYFYSDIAGRTAFNNGDFYIQDGVNTYYNYATNQYHGNTTGTTHSFRSNALTGTNWGVDTSGNISGLSYKVGTTTVIDASRNLTNIGTISSGAITSTGDITTSYAKTISMDYAAGSGDYHKGMSGLNQSSGTARGLHLFNYDADSNEGIKFWVGTNASRSQALHIASDTNATFAGTISSGSITSSGTFTSTVGNRPVVVSGGAITMKGETGGWAFGLHAIGSSNTNHGGFGFLGGDDAFSYYYIGETYNSGTNFRFYKSGQLNIGTTTILDSSRNITNVGTISSGAITIDNNNNDYNFKAKAGSSNSWFGVYDDANDSANIIVTRSNNVESFKHVGHTGETVIKATGTGLRIESTNDEALQLVGTGTGLNFTSGANNRIYFAGKRALEGNSAGTNLQLGEHYSIVNIQAAAVVHGNLTPSADNSYDLGSSSHVWRDLYIGDLNLNNETRKNDDGSTGNEVDGSTGNWTIQEGEEHLYIINNKNGKKYKFALEEIK